MALPYDRKFNSGRQSELLLNEDLHKNYEALRHIIDTPTEKEGGVPKAKVDGALWLDKKTNELKRYHKATNEWETIFSKKFQITDEIINTYPSKNPVPGQLWINNNTLMFYDGFDWKPVKTLQENGSQFDASIFQNHIFTHPLGSIGQTAIKDDKELSNYFQYAEDLRQGKVDLASKSEYYGHNEKWDFGHVCDKDKNFMPNLKGYAQFLVPNIDTDRVFLNGKLDKTYEEESKVCIQYPKDTLMDNIPSLIHLSPSKLQKINKKFVKVDKINGKIYFKDNDFELYGFSSHSPLGTLLLPEAKVDDGGYIKTEDGAILSYNQTQAYDYVLIVSFNFGWLKHTGSFTYHSNKENQTSYYVDNSIAPYNLFINGYNLEDTAFSNNHKENIITINEDSKGLEISGFSSLIRESGFIRELDINGNGIFKTMKEYKKPLIFINGQAINNFDGVTIDNKMVTVPNGKINMTWAIAEMQGDIEDSNFCMYVKEGQGRIDGYKELTYNALDVKPTDKLIVFIDGMLIDDKDLEINRKEGRVHIKGLRKGQSYIVLKDRYNRFYKSSDLVPAFNVGSFSESLVYLNGSILCNSVAIQEMKDMSHCIGCHNEIKFFVEEKRQNKTYGSYYIYDNENTFSWRKLSEDNEEEKAMIDSLNNLCFAYENLPNSIKLNTDILDKLNIDYNQAQDFIEIYAFRYATFEGVPVKIRNLEIKDATTYTPDYIRFFIDDYFEPYTNMLSVWVDGIRQHHVEEGSDGKSFALAKPVKPPCVVTYTIETLNADEKPPVRLILNKDNIVPNMRNVYKTYNVYNPEDMENRISLYPGRVVVYVNGVRQPQEAYTVLDNFTIVFKNTKKQLIGTKDNYPKEVLTDKLGNPIYDDNKNPLKVTHDEIDEILIEVRQDHNKMEKSFMYQKEGLDTTIKLEKYDLPLTMLETNDEVLIFINGLFFGLKRYKKDLKNTYDLDNYLGALTIDAPNIIKKIISDPIFELLETNPEKKIEYRKRHNKDYELKPTQFILEWRNK